MARLFTPAPDPAVTVRGSLGNHYHCPDIATIDRHIAFLSERIVRNPPKFPKLADSYKVDIDLLLDRRSLLMSIANLSETAG